MWSENFAIDKWSSISSFIFIFLYKLYLFNEDYTRLKKH